MNERFESEDDQDVVERLRTMREQPLDPHAAARMRLAVLNRIEQGHGFIGWFLRPLWRPVLATILPFATGLAFGQSDYLSETRMMIELQEPIELATSIDASHNLIEIYFPEQEAREDD